MSTQRDSSSTQAVRLASFRHPPVRETVLGVQFEDLNLLTNAHLGAYWRTLDPAWHLVEDAMPLQPMKEILDESLGERFADQLKLELTQRASARLRITNPSQHRMIQVQSNRFHCNWLGKTDPSQEYPRYRELKPEFEKAFAGFCEFIEREKLGIVTTNQWEITYVNYIPKGTIWESPSDWEKVFRVPLPPISEIEAGTLESVASHWHYRLANRAGRLHVSIKHGFEKIDSPESRGELLIMTLTARGPVRQNFSWREGLDVGRFAIVKSFEEMTSSIAHDFWGKFYE